MMFSLLLAASTSFAAPVKVSSWTASSSAAATETANYEATNLGDSKQGTVWVEAEDGAGLGSWVLADFGAPKTIATMHVWGSNWYNVEYFGHYGRPKTLVAEYADGSTEEFTLQDGQTVQVLTLKAPKSTQTVKLRLKAVYSGKGVDSALSEVKFFDQSGDGAVPVASAVASSTAPGDGDGDYNADNATDGMSDSMWCEGNKKSDGTGETLTLTLSRAATVGTLKIKNGGSADLFKKVNRPATATVTFGDGSTETITLKDMPFEQSVTFAPRSTSTLKFAFTSVKKGTDYDDLCVSEIAVLP